MKNKLQLDPKPEKVGISMTVTPHCFDTLKYISNGNSMGDGLEALIGTYEKHTKRLKTKGK
jgi:hypothetical protein